jgi:hypothetical protein
MPVDELQALLEKVIDLRDWQELEEDDDPAPIRKEVRSGCCSQHLMNSTPSHRLWASAS